SAAESPAHDLVLLKVPAAGLPAVPWGNSEGLRVGRLVASLGTTAEPLHYAVIGALHAKNPGEKGDLPIRVQAAADGARGIVFADFLQKRLDTDEVRGLLKPGDRITHLQDIPIPSVEEFTRVRRETTAAALLGARLKRTV